MPCEKRLASPHVAVDEPLDEAARDRESAEPGAGARASRASVANERRPAASWRNSEPAPSWSTATRPGLRRLDPTRRWRSLRAASRACPLPSARTPSAGRARDRASSSTPSSPRARPGCAARPERRTVRSPRGGATPVQATASGPSTKPFDDGPERPPGRRSLRRERRPPKTPATSPVTRAWTLRRTRRPQCGRPGSRSRRLGSRLGVEGQVPLGRVDREGG